MLARKYPENITIQVFDRLETQPSLDLDGDTNGRLYHIGLSHRGRNALQRFGVWEDVKAQCVESPTRKEWGPGAPKDGIERRIGTTHTISRNNLAAVLCQHICTHYRDQIELRYGCNVDTIDFGKCGDKPSLRVVKGECDHLTMKTSFLVGADGAARRVATCMEEHETKSLRNKNILQRLWSPQPFHITRFIDNNQNVYKTLMFQLPSSWKPDFMYAATTSGWEISIESLPANLKGKQSATVVFPVNSELAKANADPIALRKALDKFVPQFSALFDDKIVTTLAEMPPSNLPSFRYAGPRLHEGDRTVILGDCAHTLKPYFGLGCNSALQDVVDLSDALDESPLDLGRAVRLFSHKSAGEAKAVVELCRSADGTGLGTLLRFVLPLIVDSIFHLVAPEVFAPNVIEMFYREGLRYRDIQRRKALDHLVQTLIFILIVVGIIAGSKALFHGLVDGTVIARYHELMHVEGLCVIKGENEIGRELL